jgi:N-carbamoylputrescine amidase
MKVGVCQLPDDLATDDLAWKRLARRIASARPDIVLLNEMPFGPWLARENEFDEALAMASIQVHGMSLAAIGELPAAVVSSRPVRAGDRLANEAFLMADEEYQALHHKHYFPQEPGYFEASWFRPTRPGFDVAEYRGLRFGVLLCTELMFTEWARHYRRHGAQVIFAPRASGTSMTSWDAAARMAAIVSGCYVLSSNRYSRAASADPCFGGRGFAYSPAGELIGETSDALPFFCADIDKSLVAKAQRGYTSYVRELAATRNSPATG